MISTSRLQVASVVSSYWVVSITMVYMNKLILSTPGTSLPSPIFITWYQCLISCLICIILGLLGENSRSAGKKGHFSEYPLIKPSYRVCLDVLPLSLVFVGMITFNNICLKLVAVSFYNVARCLSLVFNVIFTYIFLKTTTSLPTIFTLGVVVIGFYMGIEGELDFSLLGTLAGVISSVFVSLNSIFTAKVLPKVDNDKNILIFCNNFNACLLFVPLIIIFEVEALAANMEILSSSLFWSAMTITAFMGYMIGVVTVMQVKATSPLTHNISGTAKAAVQSLLAFYIWGNEATLKGLAGLFLVIFGSGLYTWVQMRLSESSSAGTASGSSMATTPLLSASSGGNSVSSKSKEEDLPSP